MKVIVDEKIPFIRETLDQLADETVYFPGTAFTPEVVKDADALIVRTRTRCNRTLLEGSRVQFIATATIGFDHIDTLYCAEKGIRWVSAPGCNAHSVRQYVQSALLLLERERGLRLTESCMGIVGVGHVGTAVKEMAESWGMRVLLNDPPRADRGEEGFVPLEQLAEECDVLTLHVPLYREGTDYPTFHLANETFFRSLKRQPYFINTSRGEVTDTATLLEALEKRQVSEAIIDVWENEPDIDRQLLQRTFLGTPHIAGYSADGKANATQMVLEALSAHFGLEWKGRILPPKPTETGITASSRQNALLKIYNPQTDSNLLKEYPENFEDWRNHYPLRREEQAYHLHWKRKTRSKKKKQSVWSEDLNFPKPEDSDLKS